MDASGITVYFAGFELGSTEDGFRDLFSQFGNIEKIFLHKTKNYGMVEFDNKRSCIKAIEALHLQPPLNLYVNMAKNQINTSGSSNSNGNTFASSSRRPPNFNRPNQLNNTRQHQSDYFVDENVTYDIEDYYMDENNEFVTVFTDPITNEIYVPLRYAPSLRKFSRKIPRKIRHSNGSVDDERLSVKSDNSERRIKVSKQNDSVLNITIQRDLENPTYKRHNKFNQGFGNSFDKTNGNNNQDKKRYEPSRNNAQWNEENRHVNRVGSKIPSNSVRPQKHFEAAKDKDEDWGSPGNVQVAAAAVVPIAVASTSKMVAEPSKIKSKDTFLLKTVELSENQFTEVHVENVVNDEKGWVTLTSKAPEFEKLTVDIFGVIDEAPTCVPVVGKLVLAFYEELWFRAIVLTTTPEIRVRYIDYGNEEVVSRTQIKEIPSAFTEIPAFASCIKLAAGAPCKIVNDLTIKVKPVKKENDVVVVHVENGIYEIEANKSTKTEEKKLEKTVKPEEKLPKLSKKDDHPLNIFHKLLLSKIKVQNGGFLEMTISLSKTRYIACFVPSNLVEEAAKLQSMNPIASPSFKPSVGDVVCAENEDGWQRVYLLKLENNKYKVAFVDFGVVEDVAEVRPLPEEFIGIPIFSCVCSSKNGHDLTQMKNVDFEITNISGCNISCKIISNEKEVEVVCVPWDPRECAPDSSAPPEVSNNAPLQEIRLQDGEDVKLEMESDGFLYVRNKYASEIRKKIDKFMAENGSRAAVITGKPYVGQLVTAEFEGDYYRAIIKSIRNNDVTICYIDYGNEETLPFFSLKILHEDMLKEPISIIKIGLRNFINKPFSVKALKYLENLSVKKVLLKVSFESPENGCDLKGPNGLSISEELEKLDAPPKTKQPLEKPQEKSNEMYQTIKIPSDNEAKILMYHLPLQEVPLGKTEVIFQQFSDIDSNLLCVCVNNPETLHKVHVELQEQISKYVKAMVPNVPYEPETEECVLVQSEGKWYRGACTSEPEDNEYTVFLVDYGSCGQFSSQNMRRMPKEFAKENALSNFAKIHGLPDANENVRNRLKTLLERNNSYPVNVLEKIEEDECYIIQFPTIIEVLKKEKLL